MQAEYSLYPQVDLSTYDMDSLLSEESFNGYQGFDSMSADVSEFSFALPQFNENYSEPLSARSDQPQFDDTLIVGQCSSSSVAQSGLSPTYDENLTTPVSDEYPSPQYHPTGNSPMYDESIYNSPQYSAGNSPQYSAGNSPQYSVGNSPQYSVGNSPQYSVSNSPQYSAGHSPQYSAGHSPQYSGVPEAHMMNQIMFANAQNYVVNDNIMYTYNPQYGYSMNGVVFPHMNIHSASNSEYAPSSMMNHENTQYDVTPQSHVQVKSERKVNELDENIVVGNLEVRKRLGGKSSLIKTPQHTIINYIEKYPKMAEQSALPIDVSTDGILDMHSNVSRGFQTKNHPFYLNLTGSDEEKYKLLSLVEKSNSSVNVDIDFISENGEKVYLYHSGKWYGWKEILKSPPKLSTGGNSNDLKLDLNFAKTPSRIDAGSDLTMMIVRVRLSVGSYIWDTNLIELQFYCQKLKRKASPTDRPRKIRKISSTNPVVSEIYDHISVSDKGAESAPFFDFEDLDDMKESQEYSWALNWDVEADQPNFEDKELAWCEVSFQEEVPEIGWVDTTETDKQTYILDNNTVKLNLKNVNDVPIHCFVVTEKDNELVNIQSDGRSRIPLENNQELSIVLDLEPGDEPIPVWIWMAQNFMSGEPVWDIVLYNFMVLG
eukprot:TRINITY_DN514_c0_g1_i1.p1 TRINITY_DN514_c0_g1~~TRINITY_DN514_c0_g1_i1.p1  ORF type:complete len:656 (-),score=176.39 TRINITY_DN514_c0_g1_i1:58-2025(-)